VTVELRMRKQEMRAHGTNHHDKLGFDWISCASWFTIPDIAGTSPNPACNHTNTMSSWPNKGSPTTDFSCLHVFSTSFSSSLSISLFVVHNSTIITEHKVKSSLSISPCRDDELTPSTSIHRVQHTPSTAYTKYSIHQVQHPPKIVCLPSILMMTSWPRNVASASGLPPQHNGLPSGSSSWELQGTVTLSHSHGC